MKHAKDPIKAASEYMSVKMFPEELRYDHVRHLMVSYKAEEIVYVLQALSLGLVSICFGIISNYLYDKMKQKYSSRNIDLNKIIAEYEDELKKLRHLVEKSKEHGALEDDEMSALLFHEKTLISIKEKDPEIQRFVEDAIFQLENYGKDKLEEHVKSYKE